jgi:hypothetical protein
MPQQLRVDGVTYWYDHRLPLTPVSYVYVQLARADDRLVIISQS